VASYDLQPGNCRGLFSKEKINKEVHKEKSEDKRISGEAYDVNKDMYSAEINQQRQ